MDLKKLGKKIKLARVELDLTQTQLAEKISGKQKSISGYEAGATLPSIRTLIKIAKILKRPATHFLDEWQKIKGGKRWTLNMTMPFPKWATFQLML